MIPAKLFDVAKCDIFSLNNFVIFSFTVVVGPFPLTMFQNILCTKIFLHSFYYILDIFD